MLGEEGRDEGVASRAVGEQLDRREQLGELADRLGRGGARVADRDDLPPARERGEHELDGRVLDRVEDHEVDGARRGDEVRHEGRRRDEHGAQAPQHGGVLLGRLPQAHEAALEQLGEQVLGLVAVLAHRGPEVLADRRADGCGQRRDVRAVEVAEPARERVEAGAVLPGQGLVLREHLLEHGAPPRELELGAHEVGLDAAHGEVGEELAETEVGEPAQDRGPRGEGVEGLGVLGERVEARRERVERGVEEVPAPGGAVERGLELLHVDAHGLVRVLDRGQPLGQHGPAAARALLLPDRPLRLHLDERGVQVGHADAGADHVARLTVQTSAGEPAHLDAALRAPLLRRCRLDHVLRGALEDEGLEHVERAAHAAEHGELVAPLAQRRRGRQPGALGDLLDLCAQLRERVGAQALDAHERVVGLLGRGEGGAVPGGRGRTRGEGAEQRRLAQLGRDPLALRPDAEHDLGREAHPGVGGRSLGGEPGERLERVVGGDAPRVAHEVQRLDVPREPGARPEQRVARAREVLVLARLGLGRHRGQEAVRRRLAPRRLGDDVEHEAAQAQLVEPREERVRGPAVTRDVEHVAPGRRGLGDDGRERARDVGPGRRVDEEVRPAREHVDDVALGRVEVAGTALVHGVRVADARRGQLGAQRGGGALVPGQRGDDLVPFQGGRQLVEVVDEDLPRVHERADEDAVGQVEVVEDGLAERGDTAGRVAGVEARAGERGACERHRVEERAVRAQRPREERVDLGRRLEGQLVVGLAVPARGDGQGAQEHRGAHGPGRRLLLGLLDRAPGLTAGVGDVRAVGLVVLVGDRGTVLARGATGAGAGLAGVDDVVVPARDDRRGGAPGDPGERGDVVLGERRREALGPGRHADRQVRGRDAVALGVLGGADHDGARAASRGGQRPALAEQVGEPGRPPGEELGDARGVGRREVDAGVAEQRDVGERRPAGELDEPGAPPRHRLVDEVGRRGLGDEHGAGRRHVGRLGGGLVGPTGSGRGQPSRIGHAPGG